MPRIPKKLIPGLDGYFASANGRIYRETKAGIREVPQNRDSVGYWSIQADRKAHRVHRLVLLAFVGQPPQGKPLGLHKDDNKDNNHISNLYYGDHQDNTNDKLLNAKPVSRKFSKLHRQMMAELAEKYTGDAVADLLGIDKGRLRDCLRKHRKEA